MKHLSNYIEFYSILNEGETWEKLKLLFKNGWNWLMGDNTVKTYAVNSSHYDEDEKIEALQNSAANAKMKFSKITKIEDLKHIVENSMPANATKDKIDIKHIEKGFVRIAKLLKDNAFDFNAYTWFGYVYVSEEINEVAAIFAYSESLDGSAMPVLLDMNKIYFTSNVIKFADIKSAIMSAVRKTSATEIKLFTDTWVVKALTGEQMEFKDFGDDKENKGWYISKVK